MKVYSRIGTSKVYVKCVYDIGDRRCDIQKQSRELDNSVANKYGYYKNLGKEVRTTKNIS